MTQFFIPLKRIPTVTKQMTRVTWRGSKPVYYDSPAAKEAKALFLGYLAPYAPDAPALGPVRLSVTFVFGTNKPERMGRPHTHKPDTDNLIGILKDCMTKIGFWRDDCQVADEHVVKAWDRDKRCGIYIQTEEIL